MAYSKYVTEFNDKDNNTYGVMDSEGREATEQLKNALGKCATSNVTSIGNNIYCDLAMNLPSGTSFLVIPASCDDSHLDALIILSIKGDQYSVLMNVEVPSGFPSKAIELVVPAGETYDGIRVRYHLSTSNPNGATASAMLIVKNYASAFGYLDEKIDENSDALVDSFDTIVDCVRLRKTKTMEFIPNAGVNTNVEIGSPVSLVLGNSSSYDCIIEPCKRGDIFTITATGGNSPRAWAVLDANCILLEKSGSSETVENYKIVAPEDGFIVVNNAQTARDQAKVIKEYLEFTGAQAIYETASDVVAEFGDGADDVPTKSLIVNIGPNQSGTGYPSPSNVRPLNGWTGINVVRGRKVNLDDVVFENGYYDDNGNSVSSAALTRTATYIPVVGGVTYSIVIQVINQSANKVRVHEYDSSQNWLRRLYVSSGGHSIDHQEEVHFTVSSDAAYIRFSVPNNSYLAVYSETEKYTLDFTDTAGTVYGGTLDVVNGVLNVDRLLVPNANTSWIYADSQRVFYKAVNSTLYTPEKLYCNLYTPMPAASVNADAFKNGNFTTCMRKGSVDRIYIRDDRYTDAASFMEAIADIQIAIQLKTPSVYRLTPVEVRTLLGQNSIWADAGSVSAEYQAYTKTYVDTTARAYSEKCAPAILETVSGSAASFEDGADDMPLKSLTVNVDPVQNLNGYDKPWPGGSGKNLLGGFSSTTISGITISDTTNGVSISGTMSDEQTQFSYTLLNKILPEGNYIVNGVSGAGGSTYQLVITGGGMSTTKYGATNNTTFTSDGTTAILIRLFIYSGGSPYNVVIPWQIESGMTVTSYAPYSNTCPISGWTGAKVTRTGKNLVNVDDPENIFGYITNQGVIISATTQWTIANYIPVIPGNPYILSGLVDHPNTGRDNYLTYDRNKNLIGYVGVNVDSQYPVTFSEGVSFVRFCWKNTDKGNVMFYSGAAGAAYEPYKGDTCEITFPTEAGTVYGGTLDVENGTLKVDKAIYDLGNAEYAQHSTLVNRFSAILPSFAKHISQNEIPDAVCSAYPCGSYTQVWQNGTLGCCIYTSGSDKKIGFCHPNCSDLETFTALMAGQTMVYPLTDPIVIKLSNVNISTLLGYNAIWADTGDVTVEYSADTKLFIQRLTQPDQDMTADANIESGKYFMVGNSLYLSTAAIAAGETITPGTNCTQTNLAAALNALAAQ